MGVMVRHQLPYSWNTQVLLPTLGKKGEMVLFTILLLVYAILIDVEIPQTVEQLNELCCYILARDLRL